MKTYTFHLTDSQWDFIKTFLPGAGRKRRRPLRDTLDAILHLLKTGCQWRMLPPVFGPWQTVRHYFDKWKAEGVIEEILRALRGAVRRAAGREECPSLGVIDSRSARTSHHPGPVSGVDGGKKVKGRKMHIIVDSQGLLLAVSVHAANIHDSIGAASVLEKLRWDFPRLRVVLADGGYRGERAAAAAASVGVELRAVPLHTGTEFKPDPIRWVVERSFSWVENYRRLTIDYEYLPETTETMVQLAFIHLMLQRIF